MRVDDWTKQARVALEEAGIESAGLEAQLLAGAVLGCDRSSVIAHPEWKVSERLANDLLERRLAHEPLAYLIGYREFYGRRFRVAPGVLIPRQETETIISAWLELGLPANCRLLDLGTGSGCIGITLKLEQPQLSVVLCDVSESALDIARENARALGADVNLVHSDGFQNLGDEKFDAIVTNPPYVARGDALPREVSEYEPSIALFSGESGLEFYERLAGEAREHLQPFGILLTEVGDSQAEHVKSVFEHGGWKWVRSFLDLMHVQRALAFSIKS